jgi:hypothetical protein
LAFTILQALKEALTTWNEADGYALADDVWHVTAYYDNIRNKVAALGPEIGECNKYAEQDLQFVCNYPMKVRTRKADLSTTFFPKLVISKSTAFLPVRHEPSSLLVRTHPGRIFGI